MGSFLRKARKSAFFPGTVPGLYKPDSITLQKGSVTPTSEGETKSWGDQVSCQAHTAAKQENTSVWSCDTVFRNLQIKWPEEKCVGHPDEMAVGSESLNSCITAQAK